MDGIRNKSDGDESKGHEVYICIRSMVRERENESEIKEYLLMCITKKDEDKIR